jgi:hypothetical protein
LDQSVPRIDRGAVTIQGHTSFVPTQVAAEKTLSINGLGRLGAGLETVNKADLD